MARRPFVARLIVAVLRLLGATWRVRVAGDDPFARGPVPLGAVWHSDLVMAGWYFRDRGFLVPVSLSRDGELFDGVLERMGFDTARGSSSRGGRALLRELIRCVQAGRTAAVIPDGPRGPAGVAKAGIVAVAANGGVPVLPVAFRARPAWRLGSWDRLQIPLPFARVICRYGEPVHVPKGARSDEREKARRELEQRLDALGAEAEALLRKER